MNLNPKLLVMSIYLLSSSLFANGLRTVQDIMGNSVSPTIIQLEDGNEIEVFRVKNIISRNVIRMVSSEEGGYVGKDVMLKGRRSGNHILLKTSYIGEGSIVFGNAQIAKETHISGNVRVTDNVQLTDSVHISGNVYLSGSARVSGNARLSGNARVSGNAQIMNNANISDDAYVTGNAIVWGNGKIYDHAEISGNAQIYDSASIFGNAKVTWDAKVFGFAKVYDDAMVSGNAQISWDEETSRPARISGQTYIFENILPEEDQEDNFENICVELNEEKKFDQCYICLDKFKENRNKKICGLKVCDHIFHHECLKPWHNKSKTCPICRKETG